MIRLTEDRRALNLIGLCLLGLCLWLGMGNAAQADSAYYAIPADAQTMTMASITNATAGNPPIVVCGGQPGHRSLEIRGADVATLWRSAYRMLFPTSALVDKNKMDRGKAPPEKGPTWLINVDHGDALVTVQTKW